MATRKTTPKAQVKAAAPTGAVSPTVNLDHYVPAYLTWIANKLSRGASQQYLNTFDVGIETWRCLVLLAIDGSVSAQHVSRVIGMDKGSVSRCFKGMQERGLIRMALDDADELTRLGALARASGAQVNVVDKPHLSDFQTPALIDRDEVVIGVATYAAFAASGRIAKVLGRTGINIMTRLMGLILAAMAVELLADGLVKLFPVLASPTLRG